jgi:hypothetical protein
MHILLTAEFEANPIGDMDFAEDYKEEALAFDLPLFRQLRGDLTARGKAARSPKSAALEPRTKTADRVR